MQLSIKLNIFISEKTKNYNVFLMFAIWLVYNI